MIQKLIDADEFRREMFRKCIETDEEVEKGRAKWESGLWIRYKVFEDTIEQMPSVQPEQKRGKWLTTDAFPHHVYCSVCGKTYIPNDRWQIWVDRDLPRSYCPNCGARMEETNNV